MKLTALFAALIAGALVVAGCNRGPDQPKNTGAQSSSGATSSQPADAPKRPQSKP